MPNMVDHARQALGTVVAPLQRWPLFYRTLILLLSVVAYVAGVLGVDAVSGEARLPEILFLVYFLPAVLRAWLMVYWQARKDLREFRRRRSVNAH